MAEGPISGKWRAKASASLLVLFTMPFAMGVVEQLIVPVIYTLAVIVFIRLVYALIRRRY